MIRVGLDAGHGSKTPGKRCNKALDPNQTREWWLNTRVVDKVVNILKKHHSDIEVYTTSMITNGSGRDVPIKERAKYYNDSKCDIVISVHHNAAGRVFDGGGTVVYYYAFTKKNGQMYAEELYNAVTSRTNLIGNRSNKIVGRNFGILSRTNAPAVLIENGFMDSTVDTPIILSEEHAEKTARGIVDFIANMYNLVDTNKTCAETDCKECTCECTNCIH